MSAGKGKQPSKQPPVGAAKGNLGKSVATETHPPQTDRKRQHEASDQPRQEMQQGAADRPGPAPVTACRTADDSQPEKLRRVESPNEPETQPGPSTSKVLDNPELLTEEEIFADPCNALIRLRVPFLAPQGELRARCSLKLERFTPEELDAPVVPISGISEVVDRPPRNIDFLRVNDVIGDGYLRIIGMIGRGGFGQVYAAWDARKEKPIAIKAETVKEDVLKEREVLLKFKNNLHSPEFLDVFKTKRIFDDYQFYYVVLQLLSFNLQQIRHKCKLGGPTYRLSMATAYGVTVQCLDALKGLHRIGYIHRDIKPANFAIGVGRNAEIVYLYDFGLCRRFLDANGEIVQMSEQGHHGFKGTLRYASRYAHYHEELGRRDDLISLYYSFIELIRGHLPWKRLNRDKEQEVQRAKEKFRLKDLCKGMPAQIRQFARSIQDLLVDTEPNYDEMCDLLRVCMTEVSNGIIKNEYTFDYEWLYDNCTTFEHFTAAPKEMPQKTPQKTPEQEAGPAPRE